LDAGRASGSKYFPRLHHLSKHHLPKQHAPNSMKRPTATSDKPSDNSVDNSARTLIPHRPTLAKLKTAAAGCRACPLWLKGTQTVFGEGSPRAEVMLVGEQPGDKEDLAGRPFVGPAGRILNEALEAAGIDRSRVYVTNIVKHFNWVPDDRGKRRIHKKPRYSEVKACRPWLEAEIQVTRPRLIVCLGATAAQGLLGREFSVTRQRGTFVDSQLADLVMATVHPSSILRAADEASRGEQKAAFIHDLRVAAKKIRSSPKAA
jgi:uracil-DNA glycosylase family protein